MPTKKTNKKKARTTRERLYCVKVCKVSVGLKVVLFLYITGCITLSLFLLPDLRRWTTEGWFGLVFGLCCYGIIPLLCALAWIPYIGNTVIRMSAADLYVWGERIEWDKIASIELRAPSRTRSEAIGLTLTDDTTFTIDDGAYTRSLEQIYRQLRLRVRSP